MLKLTGCTVDLERRLVQSAGTTTPLTTREADLLRYLAERPEQPVSRDELLQEVWEYHREVLSRALDSTVSRLRSKIEADPANPTHLLTEHGHGYKLVLHTQNAWPQPGPREPLLSLSAGPVDLSSGRVFRSDGLTSLCSRELALLQELMRTPGRAIDSARLERKVWGTVIARSNRLRNAIYRMRTKIERDPSKPEHLLSVTGGYLLELPEPAPPSGRVTVLAADLCDAIAHASLDEAEMLVQRLWDLVRSLGGYATSLGPGRVYLVFAEIEPARAAAARVRKEFAEARIEVVTGEARRCVNPLSHRFEYVGPALVRAFEGGGVRKPVQERGRTRLRA